MIFNLQSIKLHPGSGTKTKREKLLAATRTKKTLTMHFIGI